MAAKSPLDNVINLAKRRGFVFQAGNLIPALTVREQLMLPTRFERLSLIHI